MPSLAPYSQPLGREKALHLLRRATFGPKPADVALFSQLTPQQALDQLLIPSPAPPPPLDPANDQPWIYPPVAPGGSEDFERRDQLFAWWLHSMHGQTLSLTERMVWFWHTHFPTIQTRINSNVQLYFQLQLFRHYALGDYKALTKAVCIDNAMLIHLDGHLNENGSPQENFAREFFELFTVGKGPQVGPDDYTHFTEQDVQAATRVFTGWGTDTTYTTIDPLTGIPTGKLKSSNGIIASKHDASNKTFSQAFANQIIGPTELQGGQATLLGAQGELDLFIQMVFNSVYAARHICRKLYRFFVYYQITPDVEQDIIVPLAQQLINDQFQISGVLRTLMESLHFYDLDDSQTSNDHQGALIKSPLEITLGLYRTLGLTLPQMQVGQLPLFYQVWMGHTLSTLHGQGLDFYEPYDVAGYDPYYQFPGYNRLWITPNNLAMRYKYGESLLVGVQDANMNVLLQLDPVAFVQQWVSDPTNPDTLLQEILPYFIPIPLNAQRYAFFRDSVLLDTLSAINWAFEWSAYASGGPDTNVRTQLENLFRAMIQCPEFQLM
jgi:uncharacterized protein (DUF1800 family)